MSPLQGIFDSHAHYDDRAFDGDRDILLASLPAAGITGVINCASDLDSAHACIKLAESYPFCYAAAGIHPHEAAKAPCDAIDQLRILAAHPKVVAIGEIGLDYHYDFSPRETQRALLTKQLNLADELSLPVILHDREAHGDMMEILRTHRPAGVMHCFSGSVETMRESVDLGLYIGLGGSVTFKNAHTPAEVAAKVPLDRLLIETDCPYMTPVPHRGRRNDSSLLYLVAEKIAELRGITAQEVINASRRNAYCLFSTGDETP